MEKQNERTLGMLPLIFFSIGCTVASGVFALSGDFAAAGAYTFATLIGWAITFVGMLGLMMCFFKLTIAKPELTSGIYSYAHAGFGEYMGFTSAWGYWVSTVLAFTTYHVGIFGSLSEVIPWLQENYKIKSLILGTIVLWLLVLLVLRGVNQAVMINLVVVIAKMLPIVFLVIAAILAGSFKWEIFVGNWNAPAGGDSLMTQVSNTCFTTAWVFLGIEGAVVISHRAKNTKLAGRSAVISYIAVFILYLLISVISMGVADHDTLASFSENYTFSMAGVMELVVGHWGAVLVSISAAVSIGCALFTYVLLCVDSAAGPALHKCFPAIFDRRNKYNAPTMSVVFSAVFMEIFIIVATFAESSYQNCYYLSTISLVVPYILASLYAFKLCCKGELQISETGSKAGAWIASSLGLLYGLWLFYSTCIASPYVLIGALLFFPGIIIYFIRRKTEGDSLFPHTYDAVIASAMGVLFVVAIILIATGSPAVTGLLV